jgi:type I restriction enzyme S subunit
MPGDRWAERSLGELIALEYGAGLPQAVRTGEGYPVYGSSGLLGRHSDHLIQGPGIIVGRKGTVGAVVWSDEAFWPIDTTYYVEPKGDTDLRWIYWRLSGLPLNKLDSSTGVPGLNRHDAYALKVLVPPLPEQRRIAEILDAADEAIRQTERLIAKLKAVKAGLLHDLLTRGLDEHGHLRDPQAHPEQFKDSPLGRIPREWEVCQLSEHASVLGGKRLPYGHSYSETHTGYRYLRVTDFYERPSDFNSLEHLHPETFFALARYEIHDGNLFISIAGSLGYVGVFRPSIPDRTILTENAARIEVSSAFVPEFLALQMNGIQVQKQIEAEKGTGGGVPKLALFRIRNLELVRPSIEEQYRIIAVLNAHDARIRAEEAELAKLRQVKRGLMDDLLTGKVRVETATDDVEGGD